MLNRKVPVSFFVSCGCCAVVLAVSLYFRSFPVDFPQLKQAARFNVDNSIRQKSAEMIEKQFPGLSPASRQSLIAAAVKEHKKNNAGKIKEDIEAEYLRLKDPFQNEYGQTYLMELDCWEWARMVQNILDHGHTGTTIVNGRPFDARNLAPVGREAAASNFLFNSTAVFYRIIRLFSSISLHDTVFYLPLFFVAVLIVVFFAVCARHYGILAASVSGLVLSLAPVFVPRSCAGWFDTDTFNLLFPIGIVYAYLMAYEKDSFAGRTLWVGIAAVFVGLFAWTWPWWWFICAVILVYELFKLADLYSEHLQYKEEVRGKVIAHLYSLGVFLVMAGIFILLLPGSRVFGELYTLVRSTVSLNDVLSRDIWPNVYATVGEMRKADFILIIRMVGGSLIFTCGTAAMMYLIVRNRSFGGLKRESLFLLVLWFMGSLLASFKGVRLTLFMIVPLAVLLGWSVQELFDRALSSRNKPLFGAVCCLAGLLVFLAVNNGRLAARGVFPLIDDRWYTLLKTIEEKTPANTIINSWWDYGDWFKAIARRPAIFDGQSQNGPQAYWMAKVLLASSEDRAIRILRMLNNGSNRLFELIDGKLDDPLRSVLLVEKLLGLEEQKARVVLADILDEPGLQEALRILYGRPGPALFIVDESMVGKIQPISYIGGWDFTRVYVAKNLSRGRQEVVSGLQPLGLSSQQADILFQDASLLPPAVVEKWISAPLRYYSVWIGAQEKAGRVFFNNGMVYDPQAVSLECFDASTGGFKQPANLFIIGQDASIRRVVPPAPALEASVVVRQDSEGYQALALDGQLAESLFTRLFFLKGEGMRHFRLFSQKDTGDQVVRVFEIIWDPS